MPNKILIFGRTGQVGWELHRTLCCLGPIVSYDYPQVDFTHPEALRSIVREERPSIIVNAVAYTAVDKAEEDVERAMAVNGTSPAVLAEEAKKLGSLLVHYSTDYVFNGSGSQPWTETDSPDPLNVYGKSKLAGDQAIQESGCDHLIFRTSWVYGARGNNFLLTMLKLAKERSELSIVDDQIGAPTSSACIAQATSNVLSQIVARGGKGIEGRSGIYNLTNGGETSWFGFAEEIFRHAHAVLGTPQPKLIPIPTSQFPRPAQRPKYSCLSPQKLVRTYNFILPEWRNSLNLVLSTMN